MMILSNKPVFLKNAKAGGSNNGPPALGVFNDYILQRHSLPDRATVFALENHVLVNGAYGALVLEPLLPALVLFDFASFFDR